MVLQPHSGDAFYSNEAAWLECAGLWKDYDKRREATTKLNGLAERYQEHVWILDVRVCFHKDMLATLWW
jgi:hypothetical protein